LPVPPTRPRNFPIAYAELLLACEEDFGIPFDDSWAERKQLTIGELATFIRREMK